MPEDVQSGLSNGDRLGIALACLGGVLGIVLFLVEKTPTIVGLCLVAMLALLVFPILHFAKGTKWRMICFIAASVLLLIFGVVEWPPVKHDKQHQYGEVTVPAPIVVSSREESPTPTPRPEITPSPRPHKRPHSEPVSTPTPAAVIANPSDQATIGVLQAILIANDQQHTVSVPIVLKNFGSLPSRGELHCRVFFEDTVSHQKAERLPADAPQTVAFAPQQQNTYTFRIGETQALYDRFIDGSVTIRTDLRITYRPIPTNDKTTVYRFLGKLNFKTRDVEIEFSDWE